MQYNDDEKPEGWVAKRSNKKVRERFELLLLALGKEFDAKIEGINLQETAIGVSSKTDTSFSEAGYIQGLKENMAALKKSFPASTTMIYANFIPVEWLPGNDKGYLRSIYQYGEKIGVGLGGPDLMVKRKGQLNHALAMMHEGHYTVPLGIAVQDGNYIGETGDTDEETNKKPHNNIVPWAQRARTGAPTTFSCGSANRFCGSAARLPCASSAPSRPDQHDRPAPCRPDCADRCRH